MACKFRHRASLQVVGGWLQKVERSHGAVAGGATGGAAAARALRSFIRSASRAMPSGDAASMARGEVRMRGVTGTRGLDTSK